MDLPRELMELRLKIQSFNCNFEILKAKSEAIWEVKE